MTAQPWTQAAAELRRRGCQRFGHDWDSLINADGRLRRVVCSRCGVIYRTTREGDAR